MNRPGFLSAADTCPYKFKLARVAPRTPCPRPGSEGSRESLDCQEPRELAPEPPDPGDFDPDNPADIFPRKDVERRGFSGRREHCGQVGNTRAFPGGRREGALSAAAGDAYPRVESRSRRTGDARALISQRACRGALWTWCARDPDFPMARRGYFWCAYPCFMSACSHRVEPEHGPEPGRLRLISANPDYPPWSALAVGVEPICRGGAGRPRAGAARRRDLPLRRRSRRPLTAAPLPAT